MRRVWWHRGQHDEVFSTSAAAEELVRTTRPPRRCACARLCLPGIRCSRVSNAEGLLPAEEALDDGRGLGLDEPAGRMRLTTIGTARELLGDATARDDIERALEIAIGSELTRWPHER